jgi:hypothetical protein
VAWTSIISSSNQSSNLVDPYTYENELPAAWPRLYNAETHLVPAALVNPNNPTNPINPTNLANPSETNPYSMPVWTTTTTSTTTTTTLPNKSGLRIIVQHPLMINTIFDSNVAIPWQTRRRHLFSGTLSVDKSIEISTNNIDNVEAAVGHVDNTVFEDPSDFWMCQTSDPDNQIVVISRKPGFDN